MNYDSLKLVNENYDEVKRIKEYNKFSNKVKRAVKKVLPLKIKNK